MDLPAQIMLAALGSTAAAQSQTARVSTVLDALSQSYSPFIAGEPGSTECPCINATARNITNAGSSDSCPSDMVSAGTVSTEGGVCYASSYGSDGCRLYDATATPECGTPSAPPWCGKSWCWVDADACHRG